MTADAGRVALVTGANGFIGSSLCRELTRHGLQVIGTVRHDSDLSLLEGLNVELVTTDLRCRGTIRLPERTDYIIHAAAPVSDSATDVECESGIYAATCNLAEATLTQCPALRRFIYISTALVLGYCRAGISPSRPGRSAAHIPYVRYKQRAEELLLRLHRTRGLPVVILRPADVYGQFDRTSIAPMCRSLERGLPLLVGRGRARLAYCHVGTLVQAVLQACDAEQAVGRCYTVANLTTPSWQDFFGHLGAGLGCTPRRPLPASLAFGLTLVSELLHRLVPLARPPLTRYRFRRATADTTYDVADSLHALGISPDEDIAGQLQAAACWFRECRAVRQ
ncbi:MAG: NAD-dependent epimerase/dehydratase family protein [candidate division WOR-3 bacterium]